MSIHLFLSDKVFIDPSKTFINLETLNLRVGYLDRSLVEHFVEPAEVSDNRATRLPITYRKEYVDDATTAILEHGVFELVPVGEAHMLITPTDTNTTAEYPDLDMALMTDELMPIGPVIIPRKNPMTLTLDNAKLTTYEKTTFGNLSAAEIMGLFNIVEFITYGTITVDNLANLNTTLLGDPSFEGYISESLKIRRRFEMAYIHGVGIHRMVPCNFEFSYAIGGEVVTFIIWTGREEFRINYPISTIINIIPPFELTLLLNPGSMTDPISAAALSKTNSNVVMIPELVSRDQSGMRVFETRYIHQDQSYILGFDLVYRGRVPDDLESRNALIAFLLGSGVGTQALWELRFPDLFIRSSFFIVPFYDQINTIANTDIYPSIVNLNTLVSRFNALTTKIPRKIAGSFELMTVAWDKIFCGVCADSINEYLSIGSAHPTYRDFSATDAGFIEMNNNDRDWSVMFNQALSKAAGENNSIVISYVNIGGHIWVSLIRNRIAYNIMTKENYLESV